MAKGKGSLLDRMALRRGLRLWSAAEAATPRTELAELRWQRTQARQLRGQLDRLIAGAEARLEHPRIGADDFPLPQGTDWSWRPDLWRRPQAAPGLAPVETQGKLSEEVTFFHDCPRSEIAVRQTRNAREADLAPFGLRLDVYGFGGSFLSMVVDLPAEAVAGLRRRHLVRVDAVIDTDTPRDIYARLNIRHGPNTEQLVRELPKGGDSRMVEFDLAYSNLNEKRVETMWLDLIFDDPGMSCLTVRDLTFSRRPRAEL